MFLFGCGGRVRNAKTALLKTSSVTELVKFLGCLKNTTRDHIMTTKQQLPISSFKIQINRPKRLDRHPDWIFPANIRYCILLHWQHHFPHAWRFYPILRDNAIPKCTVIKYYSRVTHVLLLTWRVISSNLKVVPMLITMFMSYVWPLTESGREP